MLPVFRATERNLLGERKNYCLQDISYLRIVQGPRSQCPYSRLSWVWPTVWPSFCLSRYSVCTVSFALSICGSDDNHLLV